MLIISNKDEKKFYKYIIYYVSSAGSAPPARRPGRNRELRVVPGHQPGDARGGA